MLDRILSWIAEEIAELRKQNQPTTLYRPVSADVKTTWTYTATHTGMLYLAFNSFQRTYIGVEWNNAAIGDFAIPTGSSDSAFVIPIAVKKGDTIKVNNLNANCYLSTRTALIAWGGVLLSPYFSTLSAILGKIGGGVDVGQNIIIHSRNSLSADKSAVRKRNNIKNVRLQDIINGSNNHRIHIRLLDPCINTWMVRFGLSRDRKQPDNKLLACSNTESKRPEWRNKSLGVVRKKSASLISERGCLSC